MIELNLLPPQEINELKLERLYRWLVFYCSATIMIVLSFIVFLALIWFFITIQLKGYTTSLENTKTSSQGQSIESQQKLVDALNHRLEKISQIQNNHKYYSPVLTRLATLIPDGVRIDAFAVDEQGQCTLTGYALKRSQLLLLKEALEGSSFFEKIDNPISNLTKQVNINFSFKFDIKPVVLKKI